MSHFVDKCYICTTSVMTLQELEQVKILMIFFKGSERFLKTNSVIEDKIMEYSVISTDPQVMLIVLLTFMDIGQFNGVHAFANVWMQVIMQ